MTAAAPGRRSAWQPVTKWALFLVLLYFIGRRIVALWQSSPPTPIHWDVRWLVPAAVLYLLGWIPSVWFWRSLMRQMGQTLRWYDVLRAYLVGHLGKYVPGKALVLVIRGALVKQSGGSPVLGAVTAVYETLVFMYTGLAIAMALAPVVIPDAVWARVPGPLLLLRQQLLLVPLIVIVATVVSTPVSAWLFTRIGRKALPREADASDLAGITAGHLLQGVCCISLGWVCHAFSLGFTLRAISSGPFDVTQMPIWLASVTLSTFAGFVVIVAPGGLGVREWVLVEMLKDQPAIGSEQALIAAGLLRLVWFTAELVAAAVLYPIKPKLMASATVGRFR